MDKISGNRNNIITNGAIFILLSLLCLRKISDYDIWYHLVIGREIDKLSQIPATEFYVYPLLGQVTSYYEWGFGLLHYKALQLAGYGGINLLNAVLNLSVLIMLYVSVRTREKTGQMNILCIFWAFLLTYFRMNYRPEMILFLCLSVEIYCLENYSRTRDYRYLIPVPIMVFLLGMFHPSALFLIFVYCCYAAQTLPEDIRAGSFKVKYTIIILVASIVAATINPYGIAQLILPFEFAAQKGMLKQNFEFVPILQSNLKHIFLVTAVISLICLAVKGNRKVTYYLLYIAFGYLTIRYHRNFALFVIALYVPTVNGLHIILEKYKNIGTTSSQRVLWFSAVSVALFVSALTISNRSWGFGEAREMYPSKAAEFILKHRTGGRIFNYYNLGGYLGWRLYGNYMVSIDGRHYYYDKSYKLHDKVFWHCSDWENTLRGLNVNAIITPAMTKKDSNIISLLYSLDASRDWVLVEEEPSALLFMRREEAEKIKNLEILDKDLIWSRVMRDAALSMKLYNEHNHSYLALGIAKFKLHDFTGALYYLKRYNRVNPQDTVVQEMINLLEASGSGDNTAQKELEKRFRYGRNL